ncbi:MAG: aldolase [Chloroflexota bacterium]
MILAQFQGVGRDLFARGLVSSHSGNLSIRLGDRLFITRRGCRLGSIQEHDLIETGVNKNDRLTPLASTELAVHRAIYQSTAASAIVHAHPPHAVTLSLLETEIVPNCAEGVAVLGQVPVLGWHTDIRSEAFVNVVAEALTRHRIIMVHGHGCFAIGQLLDEAYDYTTSLEESCHVLYLLKSLEAGAKKS